MNYIENWKIFLELVQKELSRQAYQTWFNSINMLSIENNEITIEVPNRFHYEWLDSKYSSLINRSLRQSFNKKSRLVNKSMNGLLESGKNDANLGPSAPKAP